MVIIVDCLLSKNTREGCLWLFFSATVVITSFNVVVTVVFLEHCELVRKVETPSIVPIQYGLSISSREEKQSTLVSWDISLHGRSSYRMAPLLRACTADRKQLERTYSIWRCGDLDSRCPNIVKALFYNWCFLPFFTLSGSRSQARELSWFYRNIVQLTFQFLRDCRKPNRNVSDWVVIEKKRTI